MSTPTLIAMLPRETPNAVRGALQKIPGVKVRGRKVHVPHHAAPIVDRLLGLGGVFAVGTAWCHPPPTAVAWTDVEARLRDNGEVRESALGDYPLRHQRDGVAFAAPLAGCLLHHPTGSGKTLESILWALWVPGPVLAVTRASTVVQFVRQVERYTHLKGYALRAASHTRKRDRWQSLEDYLDWCHEHGQRPFVVTGYETIHARVQDVMTLLPHSLIVDESHLLKSWKRWDVHPLPDRGDPLRLEVIEEGKANGGFVKAADDGTDRDVLIVPAANRTTSALRIAKIARRRLLTTATPIRDRVRDLYAQLTLCEPDGWGSWTVWSDRYTGARPHHFNATARDTTGRSNVAELVSRMQTILHTVPAAEVRASLPGLRRETLYVERDQMCLLTDAESKRFAREAAKAQKLGKSAMVEVQIAEASARCRKAILDRIEDHVASGQKCVVFTVRRWLSKALAGHIRGRVRKKAKVWEGTGDNSQNARRQMLDEYMAHDGAGVLVGTGDAWGTSVDGLQCSEAAFFLGFPYAPGDLDQWEGRFPRLGQTMPLTLYYVIGEGTVLEHVANIVLDKLPAVEAVADSGALAGVDAILGGTSDPEALAESILAKIGVGE